MPTVTQVHEHPHDYHPEWSRRCIFTFTFFFSLLPLFLFVMSRSQMHIPSQQSRGLCRWFRRHGYPHVRLVHFYRHLIFSKAKKSQIMEANLDKVLEGLEMNISMVCYHLVSALGYLWDKRWPFPLHYFIDLCIFLGCNYLEPLLIFSFLGLFKMASNHFCFVSFDESDH